MMIEKSIKYFFKNKSLLREAMTHPSLPKNNNSIFQTLEFLGDRVIGLITADLLFNNKKDIKLMASEFTNLVNADSLYQVAVFWNVEKFFKHDIESISNKVLSDCVEAIMGAVYLDSGYKDAYEVFKLAYFKVLKQNSSCIEPKMFLQEFSQSKKLGLPVYELVQSDGADHSKKYTMKVAIKNFKEALGVGSSKHAASKDAAKNLIEKIRSES